MMRKLVAEKLNIPWNNIRLQRTAKGKPVLAKDSLNPYPNFNFNISHQGDYAVLAAEPELQVGIDVMKTSFPGNVAFLQCKTYCVSRVLSSHLSGDSGQETHYRTLRLGKMCSVLTGAVAERTYFRRWLTFVKKGFL